MPAQQLIGQTVVLIGGSAGIGLETARRAHIEGADVILTGRNPDRLEAAAADVGAQRTAAFDATDPATIDDAFGTTIDLRTFFVQPTVAHLADSILADPETRARVERVAQVRVKLAAMSPDEISAALAARRGGEKNGRA